MIAYAVWPTGWCNYNQNILDYYIGNPQITCTFHSAPMPKPFEFGRNNTWKIFTMRLTRECEP